MDSLFSKGLDMYNLEPWADTVNPLNFARDLISLILLVMKIHKI